MKNLFVIFSLVFFIPLAHANLVCAEFFSLKRPLVYSVDLLQLGEATDVLRKTQSLLNLNFIGKKQALPQAQAALQSYYMERYKHDLTKADSSFSELFGIVSENSLEIYSKFEHSRNSNLLVEQQVSTQIPSMSTLQAPVSRYPRGNGQASLASIDSTFNSVSSSSDKPIFTTIAFVPRMSSFNAIDYLSAKKGEASEVLKPSEIENIQSAIQLLSLDPLGRLFIFNEDKQKLDLSGAERKQLIDGLILNHFFSSLMMLQVKPGKGQQQVSSLVRRLSEFVEYFHPEVVAKNTILQEANELRGMLGGDKATWESVKAYNKAKAIIDADLEALELFSFEERNPFLHNYNEKFLKQAFKSTVIKHKLLSPIEFLVYIEKIYDQGKLVPFEVLDLMDYMVKLSDIQSLQFVTIMKKMTSDDPRLLHHELLRTSAEKGGVDSVESVTRSRD